MILWINGSFGAGKTTVAYELERWLEKAFVYDPENIGYFLRKNAPEECKTSDFQDISLWREFNYQTLKWMEETYPGVILAPMTINREPYFDEIVSRLRTEGVEIRHIILSASRETLLKRLKKRSLGRLSREEFAVQAIEKSLDFFAFRPEEEKVVTDFLTVDQVVEQVAGRCGLILKEDRRSWMKRYLDRGKVMLEHIRS